MSDDDLIWLEDIEGERAMEWVRARSAESEEVLGRVGVFEEIRAGIVQLARSEGIFTETAGGTTLAVTKKLVETGQLDPALETVVINTGHGLKTLDAISEQLGPRATIAPSYDAFKATDI